MSALLLAMAFAAEARPVTISSKDALLEFEYSWSAEAASSPQLNRRFRADATKEKARALAAAREDRKARSTVGGSWNPHDFSRNWETGGQTARLLSLEASTGTFTGGAHPNSGTASLLWDRKTARETSIDALLLRRGWWTGAIRQPFCTLLDRERRKRRGEAVKRSDPFGNCPQSNELTIVLEDKTRNARFDHVRVTADPYVAGPYAEGEYVISLPITAAMIARLKPEFRSSFEPQPPVQ